MNILITGGTGFVGVPLVEKLSSQGHQLFLTTRNPSSAQKKISSRPHFIQWDSLSQDFPENQLPTSLHGVINLMGENISNKRWSKKQKTKMLRSRVHATKNLIQALGKKKITPSFFISASAIGFYPVDQEQQEIDEATSQGEGFLSHLCQEWEEATSHLPQEVRKVVMRIGVVLGVGAGAMGKLLPLFKCGLGGPVGTGRQMMSWIHVGDLVRAIGVMVEDESYRGVFNLVSPHPLKNKDFTKALAAALKRPAFLPVPAFALRLAMGEMSSIVLDGQKVVPKALTEKGFKFHYPHINQALASLLAKQK